MKDGNERWVLVHVEIQGYRDEDFAERMFIYFYRIYDKFRQKIVSLAVFSDPEKKFKPDRFFYNFFGVVWSSDIELTRFWHIQILS